MSWASEFISGGGGPKTKTVKGTGEFGITKRMIYAGGAKLGQAMYGLDPVLPVTLPNYNPQQELNYGMSAMQPYFQGLQTQAGNRLASAGFGPMSGSGNRAYGSVGRMQTEYGQQLMANLIQKDYQNKYQTAMAQYQMAQSSQNDYLNNLMALYGAEFTGRKGAGMYQTGGNNPLNQIVSKVAGAALGGAVGGPAGAAAGAGATSGGNSGGGLQYA